MPGNVLSVLARISPANRRRDQGPNYPSTQIPKASPVWVFGYFGVWVFLSLLRPAQSVFATETNSSSVAPKFLGAQSCSTSGCHGGAGELSKQVTVWQQYDFHYQRPVATLTTARSERLANILKIADPTQDARCTACHAPFQTVPAARLGKEAKISEGVSCESCHGPAENWLLSHTRKDYSHADRVHARMRDLKNPYVRANTCVACHQNVDSDLVRAGHPELIFELDGQAVTQPKHWRKELGKPGPQLWLVGQLVALREMSWQLATEKHPHSETTNRWAALLWLLRQAQWANGDEFKFALESLAIEEAGFAAAQRWADQLARAAAESEWTEVRTRQTLAGLAGTASDFEAGKAPQLLQARRAERLVLALDRLTQALPATKNQAVSEALNRLFAGAQSLPDFDPNQFAKDLKEFHTRVASALESK